ncbi:MAG: 6-hydroxymethylpterin diphosphokinase MptE-like protein [Spirochaetia bacterium]|nr:6-hydroxymethylpterin diphosphokinase MptE-like protein [Spirochaetia bacterium]
MQEQAPLLTEVSGGTSIVFKNKELYSRSSPRTRAEERAAAFELETHTLYILASPLLWYGVAVLLKKLPPSSHIIAVEQEPQLAALSISHQPLELSRNEQLDIGFYPEGGLEAEVPAGNNPESGSAETEGHATSSAETKAPESGAAGDIFKSIPALVKKLGIERFRRVRLLTLNGGYRLNSRRYTELVQLLEEEVQQFWHNKYTLMHMLPLWIKNILRNLALCTFPAGASDTVPETKLSHLESCPRFGLPKTSLPVLVAGAGPSLDTHIDFIRRYRDTIYLLAVDTAYSVLLQHGIKPDMVVVQESQFYNLYDFIYQPRIEADILADISSYPQVIRLGAGNIYLYATEFVHTQLFTRLQKVSLLPPRIPPLGSVGTTAVHAALSITDSTVILAGIDFAFPPGQTHARGAPRHQLNLQHSHRFLGIEDMWPRTTKGVTRTPDASDALGVPLRTTPSLRRYADNFTRVFHSLDRMLLLKPRGLPLGIPELTQAELAPYLSSVEKRLMPHPSPSLPAMGDSEAVEGFLQREQKLLHSIYTQGLAFLEGRLSEAELSKLSLDIHRCEYLFLHFPETGPSLRKLEPAMIKRIMVTAGHYIRVIDEALELIPRS